MSYVKNLPYPAKNGRTPNFGTDIEFATLSGRQYAFAGSYKNGMQIVDITDPQQAHNVATYDSAQRATEVHRLMAVGAIEATGLVRAEDHLTTLLIERDPSLLTELAERRLAPLTEATPSARGRLLETLEAWLEHHGSVPEVARALHVHPQTVRYRLNQLRDLFGDDLDDPDARFELMVVTRARTLRGQSWLG
jgi:DNA-binding PucR family transcriptional regulator